MLGVSSLKKAPEIKSVHFCWHGTNILAWCKYQHGYFSVAPINHPALLLDMLPCSVGVPSVVTLLPSYHSKGNLSLGIFSHLEKVAIMSSLGNLLTLELVCIMLHCLVVPGTNWGLRTIYTIGLGCLYIHSTAILHWNSAKIDMLGPLAIKTNYLF